MKASSVLNLLFFSVLLSLSPYSLAQDDSDEDDDSSGAVEEILVTATRRGESDIMSVPLAITALTGEDTQKFAIRDLNDVAVSIPGLSNGSVSGFNSAQFSMRGTTETSIILYKESPVGVTLDEFVVPVLQTANLEMFDELQGMNRDCAGRYDASPVCILKVLSELFR